jgi:hypothetical protein
MQERERDRETERETESSESESESERERDRVCLGVTWQEEQLFACLLHFSFVCDNPLSS